MQPGTAARPGPALAVPAGSKLLPAQRPQAEQQPDRQDRDEEMASPEKAPAHQENGQASPGKAQPRRAKALARPPKPAPPPRQKTSRPPRLAHRSRGITGGLVLMLVVFSAGSRLHADPHAGSPARHAGTVKAKARASPEVGARGRAAAWVASQVSPGVPISCDQAMCRALESHGVPAAVLVMLKPGEAHPLRSKVVVVTSAVTRMVGSRFIAAGRASGHRKGPASAGTDLHVLDHLHRKASRPQTRRRCAKTSRPVNNQAPSCCIISGSRCRERPSGARRWPGRFSAPAHARRTGVAATNLCCVVWGSCSGCEPRHPTSER